MTARLSLSIKQDMEHWAGSDPEQIRALLARAVAATCPAWLADQRQDLVQAAWLRIAEMVERAGDTRSLSSSYLWRVATTTLIDEIRRVRAERRVVLPAVADPDAVAASDRPGPHREIEGREVREAIADCLAGIVRSRRRVVTMHLIGYTPTEMAELTGLAVKQTRNLLFRGLTDLRECLRSKGVRR